jgi:hypothetical protein
VELSIVDGERVSPGGGERERVCLGEVADAELAALAGALGLGDEAPAWRAQLAAVIAPCAWARRGVDQPGLPSGVSHRRPFGFSIVLGAGAPELRCFLEAQAEPATPASYWAAGEAVTAAMVRGGGDARRLATIAELFVPTDAAAPFRVWHGGVFRRGRPMLGKVYLCPAAQGRVGARERVAEAMRRLGCSEAFETIDRALRPEPALDEITIVSLDLEAGAAARVKLYALLRDAGPARSSAACQGMPVDAALLARAFFDDAADEPRWWLVCLSWRDGQPGVALHLGLHRHAAGDADATARLEALATECGIDAAPLRACRRALGAPANQLHFVSLQRAAGGAPRLSVYFAPRGGRGAS